MARRTIQIGSAGGRNLLEHAVSIVAALFLVFLVRSSFCESYKIPSGSMVPTILIGDHVFVNKLAYRFTLPFSEYFGDPIPLFERGPPARGDIVVFRSPRNPRIDYIKRVVGLPGETIMIRDRVLSIDGRNVEMALPGEGADRDRAAKALAAAKLEGSGLELLREDLGERKHWILLDARNLLSENFGPYRVPEGRIFVMGDNRDFSEDSRFLGAIPLESVRGRASWVWLSVWLRFDPFELDFRPLRMGHPLQAL